MSLKKILLDKVPNNIQHEPRFLALLDHVKSNNIVSVEHLRSFLTQEKQLVESWVEENNSSTTAKKLRESSIRLEMLNRCCGLVEEHFK